MEDAKLNHFHSFTHFAPKDKFVTEETTFRNTLPHIDQQFLLSFAHSDIHQIWICYSFRHITHADPYIRSDIRTAFNQNKWKLRRVGETEKKRTVTVGQTSAGEEEELVRWFP